MLAKHYVNQAGVYQGIIDGGDPPEDLIMVLVAPEHTSQIYNFALGVWEGDAWRTSLLCSEVDLAADAARAKVAGAPLRAMEYDRARVEAEQFAASNYQGTVPPMVAAWAINGRTPQQAADNILAEAAQYTAALVQLRTARLQAKEQIRTAMAVGQVAQAQAIAAATIAAIEAAVAGIGNNA